MEFNKTRYANLDPDIARKEMKKAGYRQVSRKFKSVARVDIPIEEMKQYFIDKNYGHTKSGVPSCTTEIQCDHYRRCVSNDVIDNVPEYIMKCLR